MTRFELELKRRELAAVAERLDDRTEHAHAAGDRALAGDLAYASSMLRAIADAGDDVVQALADEPLERTPATTRRTGT